MSKHQDLKKALLAYAAILRSLKTEVKHKLDTDGLTPNQLAVQLEAPRSTVCDFLAGKRAMTGSGISLPALCRYVGYSAKQVEACVASGNAIRGDKYYGATLLNDASIRTLIDLHESFSLVVETMNAATFSRVFGSQAETVTKCLNWNIDGMRELDSEAVNQAILERLIDDKLPEALNAMREQDIAEKTELCRKAHALFQAMDPQPQVKELAVTLGVSSSTLHAVFSYETSRRPISKEIICDILRKLESGPSDQPSEASAPEQEAELPEGDIDEELMGCMKALDKHFPTREELATALGIPKPSLSHLFRGSASAQRKADVLALGRQLKLIGNDDPPPPVESAPRPGPETVQPSGSENIENELLASMHATARVLKTLTANRNGAPRSHGQQVLVTKIISILFQAFLSGVNLETLMQGLPLEGRDIQHLQRLLGVGSQ